MIRAILLAALIAAAASTPAAAQTAPVRDEVGPEQPAVKKSHTGICHAKGSPYYNQTKKFEEFESLQACLDSGGRLPGAGTKPLVKKALSSGICHDPSSPSYRQIEKYEAYKTMEECLASGEKRRAGASP
jgi:hypothetical protein